MLLEITNLDEMAQETVVNTALWQKEGAGFDAGSLFRPFPMEGHLFRVSNIPYDVHVFSDVDPDPPSPRSAVLYYVVLFNLTGEIDLSFSIFYSHLYSNRGGYEVTGLATLCEIFDCTFEFTNPADNSWGIVGPDGTVCQR